MTLSAQAMRDALRLDPRDPGSRGRLRYLADRGDASARQRELLQALMGTKAREAAAPRRSLPNVRPRESDRERGLTAAELALLDRLPRTAGELSDAQLRRLVELRQVAATHAEREVVDLVLRPVREAIERDGRRAAAERALETNHRGAWSAAQGVDSVVEHLTERFVVPALMDTRQAELEAAGVDATDGELREWARVVAREEHGRVSAEASRRAELARAELDAVAAVAS